MIHVCTMCGIRNICTRDEPSLDCLRAAMEIEERKKKPKTNADLIRSMIDEDLALWIGLRCGDSKDVTFKEWLEWLKEEVKE